MAGPREHAVIDCVAIFYEEGKGGENYRKKIKFRCQVDKEEKDSSSTGRVFCKL